MFRRVNALVLIVCELVRLIGAIRIPHTYKSERLSVVGKFG